MYSLHNRLKALEARKLAAKPVDVWGTRPVEIDLQFRGKLLDGYQFGLYNRFTLAEYEEWARLAAIPLNPHPPSNLWWYERKARLGNERRNERLVAYRDALDKGLTYEQCDELVLSLMLDSLLYLAPRVEQTEQFQAIVEETQREWTREDPTTRIEAVALARAQEAQPNEWGFAELAKAQNNPELLPETREFYRLLEQNLRQMDYFFREYWETWKP